MITVMIQKKEGNKHGYLREIINPDKLLVQCLADRIEEISYMKELKKLHASWKDKPEFRLR